MNGRRNEDNVAVIPGPIMTSRPGSFPHGTILGRLPAILDAVLNHNSYPGEVNGRIISLRSELTGPRPVEPLRESADDRAVWDAAWSPWAGCTWLEIPWFFAEAFFYRRLLECMGYYGTGPWAGCDPFRPMKRMELVGSGFASFYRAIQCLSARPKERLESILSYNLWGNRADLTFRDMAGTASQGLSDDEGETLLIDHRRDVWCRLSAGTRRIDIINDNCGIEVLMDLALASFLLEERLTQEVHLHLKSAPYFVSDAMIDDIIDTITRLEELGGQTNCWLRPRDHLHAGRLLLHADPFWVLPLGFHRMPGELAAELARADLVFIKGDANYRRLVDDRMWPPGLSLAHLTSYFPAPFVTLRTLKSELVFDIPNHIRLRRQKEDPQWMTSGHWGLIQLVEPGKDEPPRAAYRDWHLSAH